MLSQGTRLFLPGATRFLRIQQYVYYLETDFFWDVIAKNMLTWNVATGTRVWLLNNQQMYILRLRKYFYLSQWNSYPVYFIKRAQLCCASSALSFKSPLSWVTSLNAKMQFLLKILPNSSILCTFYPEERLFGLGSIGSSGM